MRGQLKFPALVMAKPPKHRNVKLTVAACDLDVDIPSFSSADTALAMTVGDRFTHEAIEFRQLEGKLYKSIGTTPERFFTRAATGHLNCDDYLMGHIVREITRDAKEMTVGERVEQWPERLVWELERKMNSESEIWKQIDDASPKLLIDRDQGGHVDRYRKLALDRLSQFVVIDGSVWVETLGPCYVARNHYDYSEGSVDRSVVDMVAVRCVEDFLDVWPEYHLHGSKWRDPAMTMYGPGQVELVAGMASGEALRSMQLPSGTIEVMVPEALKLDFEELAFDRAARIVADEFSRWIMPDRDDRVAGDDFVQAWCDLCDCLDSYDPLEGLSDELEPRLREVLELGRRDPNAMQPATVQMLDDAFERWEGRTATFDVALPMVGMG